MCDAVPPRWTRRPLGRGYARPSGGRQRWGGGVLRVAQGGGSFLSLFETTVVVKATVGGEHPGGHADVRLGPQPFWLRSTV